MGIEDKLLLSDEKFAKWARKFLRECGYRYKTEQIMNHVEMLRDIIKMDTEEVRNNKSRIHRPRISKFKGVRRSR